MTFDRAAPRRFDLVVGADGLHSDGAPPGLRPRARTTSATWACTWRRCRSGAPPTTRARSCCYNTPGRLASIHPARGYALAAFIFRGPPDPRPGLPGHRRDTARSCSTPTPAPAGGCRDCSTGCGRRRLVLRRGQPGRPATWTTAASRCVGDAASCVSLLGDGSSLAMAGAPTPSPTGPRRPPRLAEALRALRSTATASSWPRNNEHRRAAGCSVPKTRLGIAARNLSAKAMPSGTPRTRSA